MLFFLSSYHKCCKLLIYISLQGGRGLFCSGCGNAGLGRCDMEFVEVNGVHRGDDQVVLRIVCEGYGTRCDHSVASHNGNYHQRCLATLIVIVVLLSCCNHRSIYTTILLLIDCTCSTCCNMYLFTSVASCNALGFHLPYLTLKNCCNTYFFTSVASGNLNTLVFHPPYLKTLLQKLLQHSQFPSISKKNVAMLLFFHLL